ncbi:hypothetical protein [Roseiconus lacunae]|uniref:Uncharacterized protein n=1 Tax=Roseiconus lacunae TaxID=2605694 RepID=A0ABT7PQL5_9BACT|nr:hypothetical protein [Roseiconus lacunae]MDM4018802.1 hypothetical protein [Roseiconus lacunae]
MSRAASNTPLTKLPWLFGPRIDVLTFGGSCLLAFAFLGIGNYFGVLHDDTPDWTWVIAILLIDVAHVYATGFRVYFDPGELRRRPWLYGLTPVLAFTVGWAFYSESSAMFWRCLAYLAVFHFIRQQYGWVALYRRKANDHGAIGKWIDTAAIYLATVYPLVYWHSNLPRKFWWFQANDFAALSLDLSVVLEPFYWISLVAYASRSFYRGFVAGQWNPGKDLVVSTTALCWYVGIIVFNSDYAFTVTNVIIHGIPYLVLVYWYQQAAVSPDATSDQTTDQRRTRMIWQLSRFVGLIWVLAYVEELVWDRGVWHEREWLFGSAWNFEGLETVIPPLLAVPQVTHYVLDGFIWRRRSHHAVARIGSSSNKITVH